jgi:hypothetical protein
VEDNEENPFNIGGESWHSDSSSENEAETIVDDNKWQLSIGRHLLLLP